MRRSIRLALPAIALASLCVLSGDAQQQGSAPSSGSGQAQTPSQAPDAQGGGAGQGPTFRTGINFVRVDVIVSDKAGAPVSDLKAADFEVVEDNKPQTIETFKLVKLDGGMMPGPDGPPKAIRSDFDEEMEASRDDVRLFSIFLDDYHVRRGTSMAVRDPLVRFIDRQLGPSDMVGLMYPLSPLSEVRMTRNHESIEHAIQNFMGRKFDYTPRNELEERYAHADAQTIETIRNQVSLSALKGLIIHMGSLKEGRKSLILVSEGYTGLLPPQLRNPDAQFPGLNNPQAGNPFAGLNDPQEQTMQFFQNQDLETDMREVWAAAARYNVAIYAVDPRGLAGNEFDLSENINIQTDSQYLSSTIGTLRELAENSDGRAIVNRNDLDVGMRQITRDASAYYLLGYSSSQAASDGKFHEIKVRVKRPGVQVRARKGYWAATVEDVKRVTEKPKPGPPPAFEAALSTVNTPSHARVVRTWIGTSRGQNGRTRLTLVWEPVPQAPGARPLASEAPARVNVMAAGDDGTPYFRGRVPESGSSNGSSAADPHGPTRVSFDVPPGKLQLRLSVEGDGSQVLDSETRDMTVPDLTAPQVMLGSAAVYRARNVRELQQIKGDADPVPVAGREFSRSDRLVLRVPVYGPGGTTPALTARLLNRAAQPMSDLGVEPVSAGNVQLEVPLAGLPPGEYVVEIAAKDAADVKQMVGFRVTG